MKTDFAALLFTFEGRINRAQYWLAVIVYAAVTIVAVGLMFALASGMAALIVIGLVYLAMTVSGVAVGIKRLHDCDKSGWWLLLFYLGPSLCGGASTGFGGTLVFSLVSVAISIWSIVQLGFLRGTTGPNRFGPDPLAGTAA